MYGCVRRAVPEIHWVLAGILKKLNKQTELLVLVCNCQHPRCLLSHIAVTRQVAMPGAEGIRKGGMEQLAKDPLNPDLGAR